MIEVAIALLAVATLLFLVRVLRGPTIADRAVALDGLISVLVLLLGAEIARTGDDIDVDALVVVALLGFVGTAVAARFIEQRGGA